MRFGRKKEDPTAPGEAENESKSGKGGLFGFRSQDKSPAQSTNPYAAPSPSQNPYAARSVNGNPYAAGPARRDPYSASDASLTQPPTSSFGSLSLKSEGNAPPPYTRSTQTDARRNEKSPAGQAAAPRFQTQITPSYGAGYGGDNYGSSQPARMNGYGGMARTGSQDTLSTDAARSALFGAAPQRKRKQASESPKVGLPPQPQDTSYSNIADYGSDSMPGGYGYHGSSPNAQLDSEDAVVADIKKETRGIRQASGNTLDNGLAMLDNMICQGQEIVATLDRQRTMMNNAERNLDAAYTQNVVAEDQIKDLKIANRGMFVPNFKNPLTKDARERAEDELRIDRRRAEREQRDDTRANHYKSQTRQRTFEHNLGRTAPPSRSLPNEVKNNAYIVESDDEEDKAEERKIQERLNRMMDGAKTVVQVAQVIGEELSDQVKTAKRLDTKAVRVDDQLVSNTGRLDRV